MAVIDQLVVTLGLNAKSFSQGIKGSTEELAGFARRLTGVFLAVRGIEDVVGYFKDLHAQLAEIGFQARNLGVFGTEIRRLGEVSELFGGQMADAAESVQSLQAAVFNLRFRGQMSDQLAMLQRFGVAYLTTSGHARDMVDIARDAARVIDQQARTQGLTGGERYQLALSFGFQGGIASAVAQGAKGFDEAFKRATADQKAAGERVIDSQVALARTLTENSFRISSMSGAILADLTPAITALTKEITRLVVNLESRLEPLIKEWADDIKSFLPKAETAVRTTGETLGGGGLQVAGALVSRKLGFAELAYDLWNKKWEDAAQVALSILSKPFAAASIGIRAVQNPNVEDWYQKHVPNGLLDKWFGSWFSAPATPDAARPTGSSPLALAGQGGAVYQFGDIYVSGNNAAQQASDLKGQIQRKVLVSNSDRGQQ